MKRRFPERYLNCFEVINKYGLEKAFPYRIHEMKQQIHFVFYLDKHRIYHVFKRILDLLLTSCVIFFLSPVLIFVSLGCFFSIRGPVFFRQLRVGQGGKLFWILKFRSLHIHHSKESHSQSPFAKIDSINTTNSFGNFIRNYKLDELAQLFNVLFGDMSLVGPRPFSVEDSVFVPKNYDKRFYPKPGMTGLWQSQFSSQSSARAKILCDCLYARKAGFLFDLLCLFRTIRIVLLGEQRAFRYPDSRSELRYAQKSLEQVKKAS